LIARIRRHAGKPGERDLLGIGDDAAGYVPEAGKLELVTTDALVEGVHWDFRWQTAESLGRKAAAVNLSDIAAMGGVPQRAYLTLALPRNAAVAKVDAFLKSFIQTMRTEGVRLAGGDTVASTGPWMISVTLQGVVSRNRMLTRDGARPGDLLLATGELGAAAAGLAVLKRSARPLGWEEVARKFREPEARLAAGQSLAASGKVTAMLDLSDGLAGDLQRLAEASRVGARIYADLLPVSLATRMAGRMLAVEPLTWALTGGEDYELLMTCKPQHAGILIEKVRAESGVPVSIIGEIVPRRQGLTMRMPDSRIKPLPAGWEHGQS